MTTWGSSRSCTRSSTSSSRSACSWSTCACIALARFLTVHQSYRLHAQLRPSRQLHCAVCEHAAWGVCVRVTGEEGGAPPAQERAGLVYDGWLLDVPKLLDLAALYGPSNPQLLRRLVSAVRRSLHAEGERRPCVRRGRRPGDGPSLGAARCDPLLSHPTECVRRGLNSTSRACLGQREGAAGAGVCAAAQVWE